MKYLLLGPELLRGIQVLVITITRLYNIVSNSIFSFPSAPYFPPNDHTTFYSSLTPTEGAEDEVDRVYRDQLSRRKKLKKTWNDKGFKGNQSRLFVASKISHEGVVQEDPYKYWIGY